MCRLRWIGVVLVVFFVAACQPLPPAPTPAATQAPASTSPLPAPTGAAIANSPIPNPTNPSQSAVPTADAKGHRFSIDRPVKASDTLVKGTGLPGEAIEVDDVTRMGVQLGGGTVGNDGRFEIAVGKLTPSVRIGITLAEPDEAIWANPALLGPQALVVPMVGAYLDTVVVAP